MRERLLEILRTLHAREGLFVAAVLLLGLAVKIPLVLEVGQGERFSVWGKQHGDVKRYLDQAYTALAGDLQLTAKGRPSRHGAVYPLFVASTFELFGRDSFDAIRILQQVANALAVLLLYLLARGWQGRAAGNWVLGTGLVWFAGFYWSGELITESLFFLFVVATLFCLYCSGRHWAFLILAGLAMALAAQTRITMSVFVPILGIWALWQGWRGDWRHALLRTALFGAAFAALYQPLKSAYDDPEEVDERVRKEFLGQVYLGLAREIPTDPPAGLSRLGREWYYVEAIAAKATTMQFWRRLMFAKLAGFWYPLYNANSGAFYLFDYSLFFIAPFFIYGILVLPRDATYWLLGASFIATYLVILLFVYGYPRHRFPADAAIIVGGALGLRHYVAHQWHGMRGRVLLVGHGVLTVVLTVLASQLSAFIHALYPHAI